MFAVPVLQFLFRNTKILFNPAYNILPLGRLLIALFLHQGDMAAAAEFNSFDAQEILIPGVQNRVTAIVTIYGRDA